MQETAYCVLLLFRLAILLRFSKIKPPNESSKRKLCQFAKQVKKLTVEIVKLNRTNEKKQVTIT